MRVPVSIDRADHDWLASVSKRTGLPVTVLMRRALRAFREGADCKALLDLLGSQTIDPNITLA